eukprot:3328293-Prymnesium_polylepis.1
MDAPPVAAQVDPHQDRRPAHAMGSLDLHAAHLRGSAPVALALAARATRPAAASIANPTPAVQRPPLAAAAASGRAAAAHEHAPV